MAVENHGRRGVRAVGIVLSCCLAFPGVSAAQQASEVASASAGSRLIGTGGSRLTINEAAAAPFGVRDSVVNGMLVGLAVGASTGAILGFTDAGGPLSTRYCENELGRHCTQNAAVMTALFAAIGAGLGAVIDGSRRSQRISLPYGDSSSPPVGLAPVVGRGRKGMLLRVRF